MIDTIRIADNGLKKSDCTNGPGINYSVWVQGCPFHCKGCHNPETWDFEAGTEYDILKLSNKICKEFNKYGVVKNLSILGGEPLCKENFDAVCKLIEIVKTYSKDSKITVWTGYTLEKLKDIYGVTFLNIKLLSKIDYLIDGQFELENRDITLKWRGSPNQRILEKGKDF